MPAKSLLMFAAATAATLLMAAAQAASNCDSIANVPMRQHVDYNLDIQPIWNTRCANCHIAHGGTPLADLDLDPPNSWYFLVDQISSQNEAYIRVIANRPLDSLLFNKVNCETQDVGLRMPRLRIPIPVAEQALIHDWILAGAPENSDDTIFRARFETRG